MAKLIATAEMKPPVLDRVEELYLASADERCSGATRRADAYE